MTQLAQRFGNHPEVIGWQLDNEYNSVSYDDETHRQFQHWLQQCYGTLDQLNARWTTAYWSQEYTDWAHIPLPMGGTLSAGRDGGHHPSLMLDFRRFVTHVYRTYQHEQIAVIRQHVDPRQWVSHNFMGWFDAYDHYAISADLDHVSWDNYVSTGHLNYLDNGAAHDLVRGLKRRNFWLMETQPGGVNWGAINTALDRGEVRAMAWHAVGHGADAVSYWQWRSALAEQEQYHGSIIAPDGTPRPIYGEIAQLGKEFVQTTELLHNTTPEAQIAILHSYDDDWVINFQRHHHAFDLVLHLLSYYRPLRRLAHTVDIVAPHAPLNAYRLVIAPHLHTLNNLLASHLLNFVQAGDHLVLGPRSGMKDLANALLPARQPAMLASALGAHVAGVW